MIASQATVGQPAISRAARRLMDGGAPTTWLIHRRPCTLSGDSLAPKDQYMVYAQPCIAHLVKRVLTALTRKRPLIFGNPVVRSGCD